MNAAVRSLTASWPWTTIDVLNHLWQSTVVGVIVLAVLVLGHGLSARTRCTLGWMALIKFVLPTGFFVQMFARIGATPVRWVESGALAGPITLPGLIAAVPAADVTAPVSMGLVVTLVWLTGFLGLVVSWLVRGRIIRRQLFAEIQPVSREVEQRIMAAAERAGLCDVPRCFAVGGERAPGVLGMVAPIVILPRGLEATMAPGEFESVLIHELVHVQRRDNLWSAVQALFVILFWFHPVVWALHRRLALETEQSCDERVLEITGDPDTYAGGIVKAVQHALGVVPPGLMGATTPPVITRIKNIFAHEARPDRPLVRAAALGGGGLLLVLSGFTGSFAAPTLSPAAAPVVSDRTVAPLAATASAPAAAPAEPTLSVDFPDDDVRQIIRNVADLFRLNIVMPDTLTGRATVKLKDVTWRQIFQAVLAPVGYTFVEDGNAVLIKKARTGTLGLSGAGNIHFGSTTFNDAMRIGTGTLTLSGIKGPITRSGVSDGRLPGTFATPPPPSAVKEVMAAPGVPVSMTSLSALAAQSRLAAQADQLKREAETLRQEIDADRAAHAPDPEANPDPEAGAKAAGLAAIDARRQAVQSAATAMGDSARFAKAAEQRSTEIQALRALAIPNPTNQEAMVPVQAIDPRLRAPDHDTREVSRPSPGEMLGSSVESALVRQAQSGADEYHARGLKIFEPNELDRAPVPTYQMRPRYPLALRRANVSGEATVDFVVDDHGKVMGAHAVKYSHVEFAEAATEAVARWQFKPGRRNGEAVNTHLQAPLVFVLEVK